MVQGITTAMNSMSFKIAYWVVTIALIIPCQGSSLIGEKYRKDMFRIDVSIKMNEAEALSFEYDFFVKYPTWTSDIETSSSSNEWYWHWDESSDLDVCPLKEQSTPDPSREDPLHDHEQINNIHKKTFSGYASYYGLVDNRLIQIQAKPKESHDGNGEPLVGSPITLSNLLLKHKIKDRLTYYQSDQGNQYGLDIEIKTQWTGDNGYYLTFSGNALLDQPDNGPQSLMIDSALQSTSPGLRDLGQLDNEPRFLVIDPILQDPGLKAWGINPTWQTIFLNKHGILKAFAVQYENKYYLKARPVSVLWGSLFLREVLKFHYRGGSAMIDVMSPRKSTVSTDDGMAYSSNLYSHLVEGEPFMQIIREHHVAVYPVFHDYLTEGVNQPKPGHINKGSTNLQFGKIPQFLAEILAELIGRVSKGRCFFRIHPTPRPPSTIKSIIPTDEQDSKSTTLAKQGQGQTPPGLSPTPTGPDPDLAPTEAEQELEEDTYRTFSFRNPKHLIKDRYQGVGPISEPEDTLAESSKRSGLSKLKKFVKDALENRRTPATLRKAYKSKTKAILGRFGRFVYSIGGRFPDKVILLYQHAKEKLVNRHLSFHFIISDEDRNERITALTKLYNYACIFYFDFEDDLADSSAFIDDNSEQRVFIIPMLKVLEDLSLRASEFVKTETLDKGKGVVTKTNMLKRAVLEIVQGRIAMAIVEHWKKLQMAKLNKVEDDAPYDADVMLDPFLLVPSPSERQTNSLI